MACGATIYTSTRLGGQGRGSNNVPRGNGPAITMNCCCWLRHVFMSSTLAGSLSMQTPCEPHTDSTSALPHYWYCQTRAAGAHRSLLIL